MGFKIQGLFTSKAFQLLLLECGYPGLTGIMEGKTTDEEEFCERENQAIVLDLGSSALPFFCEKSYGCYFEGALSDKL